MKIAQTTCGLSVLFFAITFKFYAFVKSKNGGFFFQVAVLSLEFQGEPCVMWRITSGVGSPLQHHFVPAPIIFYTLDVKCPNTHMTVYLTLDSFRRPGF